MLSLHWVTILTLVYTISLPWIAMIVCDKIEEARRLTIVFAVGMNVGMWGFYAFGGLVRLLFGHSFIW